MHLVSSFGTSNVSYSDDGEGRGGAEGAGGGGGGGEGGEGEGGGGLKVVREGGFEEKW